MSTLSHWVLASRPATLTAAIVPVAVGTACAVAVNGFRVGPAVAALFGAICIQIGTNFANDVFDHEKGADTEARVGPTRVVQAGLLPASAVRKGMVLAFVAAALAGIYLAWAAGPVVVAIGLASIAAGIAYTGGPYPFGYHGLGDVFVLVFFGFVAVCGTTFVQAHSVPALAWWCALGVGVMTTAILVVNNARDIETDARAGKRTLAVRLGRRGAAVEYMLLMAVGYAVPVVLVVAGYAPAWALLSLVTLPLAVRLIRSVSKDQGSALNLTLVGTARLLLMYGILLAVGIVL